MNPTSSTANHMPIRAQTHNHPQPRDEDEELDEIMRDVGHQMIKEEPRQAKKHHFSFKRKPKREVPFTAQPVRVKLPEPKPAPVAAHKPMPKPQSAVRPEVRPATSIKPQPAAKPKPKSQRAIPVFVIFVAFLVTGFLIAAAVAAYRQ